MQVDPADVPVAQPGLLRDDYIPGNIGFDPLGLCPEDPEEFKLLQTKELQSKFCFDAICIVCYVVVLCLILLLFLFFRWTSCHAWCCRIFGSRVSKWERNFGELWT